MYDQIKDMMFDNGSYMITDIFEKNKMNIMGFGYDFTETVRYGYFEFNDNILQNQSLVFLVQNRAKQRRRSFQKKQNTLQKSTPKT